MKQDVDLDSTGGGATSRRQLWRDGRRVIDNGERRRLIAMIARLKADNQRLHEAYEAISRDQARSWLAMKDLNTLQRKLVRQITGRNVVGLFVD